MPEVHLPVTYWHVQTPTDMLTVIEALLPNGYYGTITGANRGDSVEWLLSLVGGDQPVTVPLDTAVIWNGISVQVLPWAEFQSRIQ